MIVDGTMHAEHGLKIDHVFIKEHVEMPEIHTIRQEKHEDDFDSKEQKDDQKKEVEQQGRTENQDIEKERDNSETPDIEAEERDSIKEDESGFGEPGLEIDDSEVGGG